METSRASPCRRPLRRTGLLAAALPALLLLPSLLHGQHRRDAPVLEPGSLEPGEMVVGIGSSYRHDARFPLSGLRGDLYDFSQLEVAYGIGDNALIRVACDLLRVLDVDERGRSHVDLADDVADGTSMDYGDFRISTMLRITGRGQGFSSGVGFSIELPNSDEEKGIGLNTTNFVGQLYGSYREDGLKAVASAGIAILEAPLENFVQNDLVVLDADLAYGPPGARWRMYVGLHSRFNTRNRVPVGTEDRGEVEAGINLLFGSWSLDLGVAHRLHGPVGQWGLDAGLTRSFEL